MGVGGVAAGRGSASLRGSTSTRGSGVGCRGGSGAQRKAGKGPAVPGCSVLVLCPRARARATGGRGDRAIGGGAAGATLVGPERVVGLDSAQLRDLLHLRGGLPVLGATGGYGCTGV